MELVVTAGAIKRAKLQSIHRHQQTNTQYSDATGWATQEGYSACKNWVLVF